MQRDIDPQQAAHQCMHAIHHEICSMQSADSSHSMLKCCRTCLMEDVDGTQASVSQSDASEAMPSSASLLSGVVPYAVAQDPVPLTSKA